ncbi:MAG: ATP-dependent DNA helicase [Actinomycetota bacterium]|nr:ATP-dependent DNA helicase [Actinomycetota bacterium]
MPNSSDIPMPIVAVDALDAVVEHRGGQHRQSQQDMVSWVAQAIEDEHHLICEAGTGVGKSFGYLVPAIVSQRRIVVATSTKTLQDQVAADLPEIVEILIQLGHDVTWAVVKGRASYLCPAKVAERHPQLLSETDADTNLDTIIDWWRNGGDGERDHAPVAVDNRTWSTVSVSGMECPGRRCSYAERCPAIAALNDARESQLVICNHHLYGSDINSDGAILGDHDAVIFDEAHRLEDALCSSVGITLTNGRFAGYARDVTALLKSLGISATDRKSYIGRLWEAINDVRTWLSQLDVGEVKLPIEGHPANVVRTLQQTVRAIDRVARNTTAEGLIVTGLRERTSNLAGHLQGDLDVLTDPVTGHVCWIEPGPVLRTSPVSVSDTFSDNLAAKRPTILTSATLTVGGSFDAIARQFGYSVPVGEMSDPHADPDSPDPLRYMTLRVESPFDYPRQARLYLPKLEEPTADGWGDSVARLADDLVEAAGGRALILCTSNAAVARISVRLEGGRHRILSQGAQARNTLLDEFRNDESSVLVATMGFWEGVDVVGDACQLVLIDRVPFPRPDDPLWSARREAAMEAGLSAFATVDLPRAANLTAQGAGRLIRSIHDEGMIVLCDRRLQTKSYGSVILSTLPEMPIITDESEAVAYLEGL